MGKKKFLDVRYDVSINTLGEIKDHSCNTDMDYNYDANIYKMVANKNKKLLNCSVPFHPPTASDEEGKIIKICNNSHSGRKALTEWNNAIVSGPTNSKYQPCAGMDVDLGMPSIGEDQPKNSSFFRLFFTSHVKVKRIILYYDFSSLTADLGGYIGVLLGISLMDLTSKFNNLLFGYLTRT